MAEDISIGTKPYSGGSDPKLPENVRKMPAKKRRQWVHVFNSTLESTGDESKAFAAANSVAKKEFDDSFGTAVELNYTRQPNILEQIKSIALDSGIEEEIATEIAEKCYSEVSWRPYAGAKSFTEIEEMQKAQEFANLLNSETYKLESIVSNIMYDDESSADERVSAIKSAADEYRQRVGKIETESKSSKSILQHVKELFTGKKDEPVELPSVGGFKVYRDNNGDYRWLSISSNSFEDLDKELFTTKALEEAIEYGDKSGERGPLLLYHIPGAEIGHCDFQAMSGRFLIESGKFDDTPMGNKALDYFVNTTEDHQVSIGYQYHDGDELDGQYDWLRIFERSITPFGAAANPWTSFKVLGETKMDEKKRSWLEGVLGNELVTKAVEESETKTKELEKTVRFKEKNPEVSQSLANLKSLVHALPEDGKDKEVRAQLIKDYEVLEKAMKYDDEEDDDDEKKDKKEAPSVESDAKEESKDAGNSELATFLAQMSESIESIKTSVAGLQSEVKALKETDDNKIASIMRPKADAVATGERPTTRESNILPSDAIKELVAAGSSGDGYEDPAKKYVDDILRRNGIGV